MGKINGSRIDGLKPRKAIQKVMIPIDYDRSEAGFNNWQVYIRGQLHPDVAEGIAMIQGVNNIINTHNPR